MVLLLPFTMIVFGIIFIKKPPAKINSVYGYRTKMSMKNMNAWIFARHHVGRFWLIIEILITMPSVIVMEMVIHKGIDIIRWIGGIVSLLQCIFLCLPLVLTEKALKRKFDENGMERY